MNATKDQASFKTRSIMEMPKTHITNIMEIRLMLLYRESCTEVRLRASTLQRKQQLLSQLEIICTQLLRSNLSYRVSSPER